MATPAEVAAMRRAIAISAAGIGTTSPNPPVGCVIISASGAAVGEGYHQRKGEGHAETQALAAAGHQARGGIALVTLEPCNHAGRTPACRQALIDAGISRVVIAVLDPTSRGDGGAATLRSGGVDVEVGVLADEAQTVLGPWLTALANTRPVVTWPFVLTRASVETVPANSPESDLARQNADAVLDASGKVTEALPDSHGAGTVQLTDLQVDTDPAAFLRTLYAGGVRRLVLHGGLDLANPFLAADLVDNVLVLMQSGSASQHPAEGRPWPVVPPGFAITEITKARSYVHVKAVRAGARG
jgi:diaminohydroxyphosphoribosylaminopyrimidine deaminase / 5-amino-6-(5-phosphoribosylamino)uracil reductase